MNTKKVALGTFLGIMLAFFVIKTPGWIADSARESRQRHAFLLIHVNLKPQKLLAACGPAAKDELQQLYGDMYEREMVYSTVHFTFVTAGGDNFSPKLKDTYTGWLLIAAKDALGQAIPDEEVLLSVGCLGGKK